VTARLPVIVAGTVEEANDWFSSPDALQAGRVAPDDERPADGDGIADNRIGPLRAQTRNLVAPLLLGRGQQIDDLGKAINRQFRGQSTRRPVTIWSG
jgi:hypothetical protein